MKKLKLEELGRVTIDQFKNTEKIPVSILLDNVRSLHNVGSVFRTADAFRFEKIYLTGITGMPPHREIHKTALGSTDSVDWQYVEKPEDAVRKLKEENYEILIIEQTTESVSLHDFLPDRNKRYCLVFGNEVNGVSETVIELAHHSLEIPQEGTKHSLNVSVCMGIIAWHFFNNLVLKAKSF